MNIINLVVQLSEVQIIEGLYLVARLHTIV